MTNSNPEYPQPYSLRAHFESLHPDNPALVEQMMLKEHARLKREGRGWKHRRDELIERRGKR